MTLISEFTMNLTFLAAIGWTAMTFCTHYTQECVQNLQTFHVAASPDKILDVVSWKEFKINQVMHT